MSLISVISQSFKLLKEHPKITLPFISSQLFHNSILLFLIGTIIFNIGLEYLVSLSITQLTIFFLTTFLIWFSIFSFFSCWGYYQNSRYVRGKKITPFKSLKESLPYYPKLLLIKFIYFFILTSPVIIGMILVGILHQNYNNILMTSILIFFLVISSIIWFILISIRLFFVQAAIFLPNKKKPTVIDYFKNSYFFSKGRTGAVILLILIIVVIHSIINFFTSSPQTLIEFLQENQTLLFFSVGTLFVITVSIISGSASAFTNMMLLQFYHKSKKTDK